MLQDSQVGIHPSLHAILGARLFCSVKLTGFDRSDTFLPADIGKVVNG